MALEDTINTAVAATETAPAPTSETPAATAPEALEALPDLDDLEVANALKAAEEEEKARAQPAAQPAAPATASSQPQAQPAPATTPTPTEPSGEMIPRSRLNQEIEKHQQTRELLARKDGEIEGLKSALQRGGTPSTAPQPQAKDPATEIKDVRAERLALAKRYDDGEISYVELQSGIDALNDREEAARDKIRDAKYTRETPTAPAPSSDLLLDERTEQLEQSHPYVAELSQRDLEFLTVKACEQLIAEGKDVPLDRQWNARESLMVRERVAQLSDTLGPGLTGKQIAKPAASTAPAAQPSGQPAAAKPAGLTPQAQARKAALDKAANAPPDLSQVGSTQPLSEPTEAAIEAMSEDEIARLPASTRAKYLGIA